MHDTTTDSAFHPSGLERRQPPRAHRDTPGRLPVVLFLLTALTTFGAGALGWQPGLLEETADREAVPWLDVAVETIATHWQRGLLYMAAVLAVLSAHEAGHWVAARLHGIRTTLPFFIPMPVPLTGTLGAVIGMEGSRADRRQLFDIALAGPVAGLVVALPLLAVGMAVGGPAGLNWFSLPPLARWIQEAVRPDLGTATIPPNALFMAGWVGLLVTGLNMIPISQLDGGHICRAVFGARGDWVARGVLLSAMAAIVVWGKYDWLVMVIAVTLIGADHPPIREDGRPLGAVRTVLGLLAFLIPAVTFMPSPLALP
jgi:membrane-associated protease RseP (regulator of RpoE activity)